MYFIYSLLLICFASGLANGQKISKISNNTLQMTTTESPLGCICGIFLNSQFKKGSKEQPNGNPVLMHDQSGIFPCTPNGRRHCINKCLDSVS